MPVAVPIEPFEGRASRKRFHVPYTIETDFVKYLNTDVPHANYTFE